MNGDDDEPKKDPYNLVRKHFITSLYDAIPIGSSEFLYRVTLEMFQHHILEVKGIIDGDYCMDEQEEMLVGIMDALTQP
jgi:hypothetical protein